MSGEPSRITFREVSGSGRFRRIRGSAILSGECVRIEMSASVSIVGPLLRHVEEDVPLQSLLEVRRARPLLRPWRQHILFLSRELKAFGGLHAQEGYRLELRSTSSALQLSGCVRDVGLAMALASAHALEERIESSLSSHGVNTRLEDKG